MPSLNDWRKDPYWTEFARLHGDNNAAVAYMRDQRRQLHGGQDEFGFPVSGRLPSEEEAPHMQLLAERAAMRRNAGLAKEAFGYLQTGLSNVRSYRPGGAQSRLSPYYQAGAQTLLAARADAPDLMHEWRRHMGQRAEKKARQNAILGSVGQFVGGLAQGAGAIAGAVSGAGGGTAAANQVTGQAGAAGAAGGAAGGFIQGGGDGGGISLGGGAGGGGLLQSSIGGAVGGQEFGSGSQTSGPAVGPAVGGPGGGVPLLGGAPPPQGGSGAPQGFGGPGGSGEPGGQGGGPQGGPQAGGGGPMSSLIQALAWEDSDMDVFFESMGQRLADMMAEDAVAVGRRY